MSTKATRGSRLRRLAAAGVLLTSLLAQVPTTLADPGRDKAAGHYRVGLTLFESGNREQALVEFQLANELSPSDDAIFMMAQCEYHLGQLKAARGHYGQYLSRQPKGPLASTAQLRIEAIDRRPSVVVINSVPVGVEVTLDGGEGRRFQGQGPNSFAVPRGRYRISVTKTNYVAQSEDVELDIAETRSLFFKLDPIPAQLEVRTDPSSATLYVRGNRARNPYVQTVEPGPYELYAEAQFYRGQRELITVGPGERRRVLLELPYVQRSGRPELIWFWASTGAAAAGAGMLTLLRSADAEPALAVSVAASAAVVGAVGGGLVANAFLPDYIRDNQALFRIGVMSIATAEGALAGLTLDRKLGTAWLGGAVGLGAGTIAGTLLTDRAPNYGRAAAILSGAGIGLAGGLLAAPALYDGKDRVDKHLPAATLIGVNVGLAAGLAIALIPDQSKYGPSWRRVALVDLATIAGGLAGFPAAALWRCGRPSPREKTCEPGPQLTARATLLGGAVGLMAGWLLTVRLDRGADEPRRREIDPNALSWMPRPTALPVETARGDWALLPGLASAGRF